MWLTRLAVNRPVFIMMVVLAFIVIGLRARGGMKAELNPRVDFPFVTITTTYPGAGPEEIETLITKPLEDAVGSVNYLKDLTSRSQEGVSTISLEFELEAKSEEAAAEVRQKVEAARRKLPRDAEPPVIEKADVGAMPILQIGLTGSRPLRELRYMADNVVKYRLGRIPGVGSVAIGGGDVREVQVLIDKERLTAYGLSINQIVQALRTQNLNFPSGHITEGRQDYSVRVLGEFSSVEEIRSLRLFVSSKGSAGVMPVYLRDVAEVKDTAAEKTVLTRINGRDSVGIVIIKLSDANTVDVAEGVKKELERIHQELGKDIVFTVAGDQSKNVLAALEDVNMSLYLGAFLATLVVFLFLHNLRGTIIVALAIPTSIIATFIPMYFLGFTLNQMTMLGLSLVTGILVDDSIVEIENTFRQFKKGRNPREAAITGRSEIGLAAITITLVDVVVFLPVAFMGGIVGRFFRQFGLTVACSTLFSLFMSFTFTPMLASRWYRKEDMDAEKKGLFAWLENFYQGIDNRYRSILAWAISDQPLIKGAEKFLASPLRRKLLVGLLIIFVLMRLKILPASVLPFPVLLLLFIFLLLPPVSSHRNAVVVGGVLALFVSMGVFGKQLKFQFIPVVDQGQLVVNLELPVGTALSETDRITRKIEKAAQDFPEVKNVFTEIGSITGGFRTVPERGFHYAQVSVELIDKKGILDALQPFSKKKLRTRKDVDIAAEIRQKISDIPGRLTTVAVRGFGGATPPVWIELYGQNLRNMEKVAREIQGRLAKIEGVFSPDISLRSGKPEVQITLDREKAASLGVDVQTLASALRNSIEGNTDSKFRDGGDQYDIRVQFANMDRSSVNAIGDVILTDVNGYSLRVRDVASVKYGTGPTKIDRKNRMRQVVVTGNLMPGYAMGNMQRQISEAMADVPLGDVQLHWGGEAERMKKEFGYLVQSLLLSIVLVYMLMASLFNSLLHPFTILLSLPMALVGAIIALVLRHETLSIISMIGFIMLVGLVMKNAILLIDYTNLLRSRGYERDKAILEAGPTRLRPILMTTMAMVLGMSPIALRLGRAAEQRAPLGVAVIGGLILSTLLTLIMIPVIYSLFDDLVNKYQKIRRRGE